MVWLFPSHPSKLARCLPSREEPACPFTACIERAQFYRARSASKKGSGPLPTSLSPLLLVIMVDHGFRILYASEQSCPPKEAQASVHVRRRPASRTVSLA